MTATINLYESFSFRWMRCHILIFFSVNVACYVYMWWWVSWRAFSFFFLHWISALPTLLSSSIKAFGTYASDDPKKETESQRLKMIMKHESIENIMEQIMSYSAFFFFSTIKCRLSRHRLFKKMMRHHRHYCQKKKAIR